MRRIIVLATGMALAGGALAKGPHALAPNVEWATHGLDGGESRFSPLAQITPANVAQMGIAWSADFEARSLRGVEATPLVVDGVMYVSGPWSVVMALDARTGRVLWRYDPEIDGAYARRGCCDVVSRGVAYAQGKIFLGAFDGRLIALDARTGRKVWSVQTTDPNQNYTITGAPRIVKNRVIIGNGGAEYAVRGYVTAYDIATGKQAWRFYTVPAIRPRALKTAPWPWPPRAGRANGGKWAGAAPSGIRWSTMKSSTCSTSGSAMAARGTGPCAARGRATTCSSRPSWRSGPKPANMSGTFRKFRATNGITPPPST
jgi:glucose dehydrogenase